MNITIKITHSNGTVMDISIPVVIEQPVKTPSADASAVVIPKDDDTASETALPVKGGLVETFCQEAAIKSIEPSGIRYGSVAELIANCDELESSRQNTLGKEKVGEDEEGAGRIGGMGERKGEGGEGEGEEENLEVGFKCSDGSYTLPTALYIDFCAAFGRTMVDHQLTLARLWCETNPQKRKTRRGMGRFLNAWMCRAQGEKRVPISARGSLLDAAPSRQEGW